MRFERYVALGDSMSIDLYPALDLGETDVAVALERVEGAGNVAPVGAASLLYRNDDARWPEEMGNDLVSRFPKLSAQSFARDGATIGDVFGEQLPMIEESEAPTIVTLTIGTYDLYSAYANRPKRSLRERIVHDITEAYGFLVDAIRRLLPNSTLVLTTVYDPSDRSGKIPGLFDDDVKMPLDGLDQLNASIRELAAGTPSVALGDVYRHFLGHGTSAPEPERWFWRRSLVEPNARGASEIRRVWLDALEPAFGA
jgi:lysophospholipase L1-like esterase